MVFSKIYIWFTGTSDDWKNINFQCWYQSWEKLFMVTGSFFLFATEVKLQSLNIKNLYKNTREGFKNYMMTIFTPKG